ncbi:MAG TPA: hypothetical protein VEK08_00295 [Planctomycetota bacterium]|nr:hypothetical protein [Planctomycetota bacterium]
MIYQRTPRGMTVIEAIIASSIFALVITLSFGITHWSTKAFHEQIHESDLTDKGEKAIKYLQEELADATLMGASGPSDINTMGYTFRNAELRFKVPLRYVSNGTNSRNPRGYGVFIQTVKQVPDGNGGYLNKPTFSEPANSNGQVRDGDFDFKLRYGWRDNQRFVPNDHDGGKMVPLQGPGLKIGSGVSIPNAVKISSSTFTSDEGATYDAGTTMGGFVRFRYVINTNRSFGKFGSGGLIRESLEKIDIDGDGLFYSDYTLGYIERSYFVGPAGSEQQVPESRTPIGDTCILQPTYSTPAYSSSDAAALKTNNIFWQPRDASNNVINPARVEIYLWTFNLTSSGHPHVIKATTTLYMRNNATFVRATSATGTDD